MIPRANITAWRREAPWPANEQVEQDLVISRALVEMFSRPGLASQAAFRGGTALHKLYLDRAGRYSEDVDLVQREPGPIGELVDAIREALDPWLKEPRWDKGRGRFTLRYRFETSFAPVVRMRLKIEINTREHFSVLGIDSRPFTVDNPWFQGTADLPVYRLDELLGTKMRALYQRRKGRDLYDLWLTLGSAGAHPDAIVDCFQRYMAHDDASASRAQFEANLAGKVGNKAFLADIEPLIPADANYDPTVAAELVGSELIARLPGEAWKGRGE